MMENGGFDNELKDAIEPGSPTELEELEELTGIPVAIPNDVYIPLPRTTTFRVLTENFGPEFTFEREVGRLMIKMGTEFVMMLSSVGYDFAEKEGMSTIAPRHIISALVYLGYGEYVDQIEDLIEEVKTDTKLKKDKKLKRARPVDTGFSAEELLKQQTELFGAARERLTSNMQERKDEDAGGPDPH